MAYELAPLRDQSNESAGWGLWTQELFTSSPRMLNADRDGKMQARWPSRAQKYAASVSGSGVLYSTSKEENFLSLAGLAATYSPRA